MTKLLGLFLQVVRGQVDWKLTKYFKGQFSASLTKFDFADLGFAVADIKLQNSDFVLFLSAELLKIKGDLIKGFLRIGVCPWLAATSCVSCLGLFSVDHLMFYLHFT